MTEPETEDPDQLISFVCERSIEIQDMIEDRKPEALEEYNKFYETAIKALDLQLEKVSSMDMESSNYYDYFSKATDELKKISKEVNEMKKQKENLQKDIDALSKECEESEKELNEETEKMPKKDNSEELSNILEEIEATKKQLLDLDKEIEAVPQDDDLISQIPEMKKKITEIGDEATGRIKKNKRKALDLEQRIRKSSAISLSISADLNQIEEEDQVENSPSMIIHRTTGTVQDQIRELKSALEEALKKNGSLKTNIKSISQDLDAMRTENMALKEIMRSIQN